MNPYAFLLAAVLAAAPQVYEVTAYSADCRGCSGITASGQPPVVGVSVACPRTLPLGTRVWIAGIGERRCDDRGSAVRGRRLDLFVADSPTAIRWGRRARLVAVLPWD